MLRCHGASRRLASLPRVFALRVCDARALAVGERSVRLSTAHVRFAQPIKESVRPSVMPPMSESPHSVRAAGIARLSRSSLSVVSRSRRVLRRAAWWNALRCSSRSPYPLPPLPRSCVLAPLWRRFAIFLVLPLPLGAAASLIAAIPTPPYIYRPSGRTRHTSTCARPRTLVAIRYHLLSCAQPRASFTHRPTREAGACAGFAGCGCPFTPLLRRTKPEPEPTCEVFPVVSVHITVFLPAGPFQSTGPCASLAAKCGAPAHNSEDDRAPAP